MSQEWVFDRLLNGRLMAEGARVYAITEEAARQKAVQLYSYDAKVGEMSRTVFIVRSKP